ncbi:dTDP-4-dehydrorhamnose reductase [Pseudomaricurvus alkylphenolicus]|uniref:dTDP-4-dehydrorhamnose reductase n=1 Tax=Pseudomaricurvus alkylphenolicus TaxID=1306991 RepID=UPI001421C42C|nr:dTDP-4-dehydrorhamnose reductase [Pseudomaricurvus alkylphenolicus]NIB39704.1 dTDP-4-dehydrorhamnose reductase [Pseudomaricurvus alkylphenolicus]
MTEKKRVLMLGVSGQVGIECLQGFMNRQIDMILPNREQLDLTKTEDISTAIIACKPHLVINVAAYTAVDKAESERKLADRINHHAAAAMARACNALSIPLFHLSTDYVFDGEKTCAYQETDYSNPINVYGRTKLDGDRAIQCLLRKHIILRTSWVFGANGNNFVKTMLRLGANNKTLRIVSDQKGCPTPAANIAAVIIYLAEQYFAHGTLRWGLYHYSGKGACSWYQFGKAIFAEAARIGVVPAPPALVPISSNQYPVAARRPLNSVLDCSKIESVYPKIHTVSWCDELRAMLSSRLMLPGSSLSEHVAESSCRLLSQPQALRLPQYETPTSGL